MRYAAIVLAAGRGSRMHSDVQKQYLMLQGHPVLYYALKAFEDSYVDDIILVTGKDDISYCKKEIVEKYHFHKVKAVVEGGKERYHSVYQGLQAISDCDYVLIHDGARPFLTEEILRRAKETLETADACVAGMPSKDTIKIVDGEGYVQETPSREQVWNIQTPQCFLYNVVKKAYTDMIADEVAHSGSGTPITDDAMVVERYSGTRVKLFEGSYRNLKITTPEDMEVAEKLLQKSLQKSGNIC